MTAFLSENENAACEACAAPLCAGEGQRGVLITFEGGDGVGKSTHIRFLAQALRAHGRQVLCLREPGGTPIGEALRNLVLDPTHTDMAPETELLIYEAARAQIVAQAIAPALERGAVVLCDRFTDSTLAYQVGGRGLDEAFVRRCNAFATQGISPARTILLVCASASVGLSRATREGADRIEAEGETFHQRVNRAFLDAAAQEPQRVRVVESASEKSLTAQRIFAELTDLFPWMGDVRECSPEFFAALDAPDAHGEDGAHA